MSSLLARPYVDSDKSRITELAAASDFIIDWSHLVDIVVITLEDRVIGFGSLHNILECVFTIDKDVLHKDRIEAFSRALNAMEISAKRANYPTVHAFVEGKSVENTLVSRFGFVTCNGASLVRHL